MSSKGDSEEVGARVARGGATILVSYACEGVLSMVFAVVVARLIGAQGFGILGIALSFIAFFETFAHFGIPRAIARFVSKYSALRKWGTVRNVLRTSFKYILALALAFSIGLAVFAGPIATHIYHNPDLTTLFQVAALTLFFSLLMAGFHGALQGFQRMGYILFIKMVYHVSRIVIAVALISIGFFATGALLGGAIGFIVACGVSLFFLLPRVLPKKAIRRIRGEERLSREILLFSAPLWLGGIAAVLMISLGPLVLGHVVPMEEVGYYVAAFSIAIFAIRLPGAMGVALFPAVSERWTVGDKRGFSTALGVTLKLFLTILVPLVVAGIIFSEFIMFLLFGAEFVAGANVLRVLWIVFLLRSLADVNTTVLTGIGRPGVAAKVQWVATGVGAAAITLLAWTHGAFGAAVGLGLGMVLLAILSTYFTAKLTGVSYPFHLLWRPVLASGGMLLFLLPMSFVVWSIPLAVLAGIIGLVIYTYAFLKLRGIGTEDIRVLRRISSDMGKPRVLEGIIRFLKRYV